ncbi:hypothetical protein [Mycobacterium sp. 852002-51971_SCH5477799-a]|uniref:hypothetical protein n=1 Tax=Mycobacterium sp. 852002-51971_SCH5477799-a TaxID=1834106 RepID=UPI000AF1CCA6|nr:hypothetical protein [Mycobacterium sp. 852002-51971_SCH5477799-a]
MTTDVCPDVCLVCGYLTYGFDLCYFCLSPVAEPLDGQVRQAIYDNSNARQSRRSCIVKAAS